MTNLSSGLAEALTAFQRGDLDRSRMLAEQEIENQPESAPAQHLLGLIDCRAGRLESGIEWLRSASKAEPDNIPFQLMLMRALVDSGRPTEALALHAPEPATDPKALPLWHARAEAADAAGEASIAEQAWRIIAAARPGDWRAVSNLGNALAAQGRWSEAGDSLATAAALNPSELPIRRNAGSALLQANRIAEALDHLTAVASADANDFETRILLANALVRLERFDEAIAGFEAAKTMAGESAAIELGLGRCFIGQRRFAEAEAALRRAIAIDPTDGNSVQQLGLVLNRTNQVDALSKLLDDAFSAGIGKDGFGYLRAVFARREGRLNEAHQLLLASDPGEEGNEQPIAWYRLKARIADELGNAEEAFEAAISMNKARDRAMSADAFKTSQRTAQTYRADLHELASTITPQWAARVPLLKEPTDRRIAFLVGFPRSGTTLLDTFLMGHPRVEVLEEEELVAQAAAVVGKMKDLPDVPIQLLRQARTTYLDALAERISPIFTGLVVDKYPLDMTMAPLIEAMFPGAPIIFAQRHPCDVVLSSFIQGFGIVNFADIGELADYYDAVLSVWMNAREAMPLNVHTVVYEELVADPAATLRPVIDFLGLDWHDELLDHQATARGRGTISTPSYDQVTEPLTKAPSGRWKRYAKQMETVLPVLVPWAKRLGYDD